LFSDDSANVANIADVKTIKEKMCFVAQDYDAEFKQATEHSTIEKKYSLPGGEELYLKE
jgi:hypothetical protein